MDNTRENLIELICSTEYGNGSLIGNNFQKGFIEKIADHLIANGVTIQRWIPVSERLPEKGETVLVCGKRGGVYTAYMHCPGYWHKLNSKSHYCDPTHWMPLPQPPKEGE